jgi:hypothetical protein
MSDRHIHILAAVARHTQRRLDDHDAVEGTPNAASTERRQHLNTRATRARARVVVAQARRRLALRENQVRF